MQGSKEDLCVGGGVAGQISHILNHSNLMDASFSKEVLNSITGKGSHCQTQSLKLPPQRKEMLNMCKPRYEVSVQQRRYALIKK